MEIKYALEYLVKWHLAKSANQELLRNSTWQGEINIFAKLYTVKFVLRDVHDEEMRSNLNLSGGNSGLVLLFYILFRRGKQLTLII